MLEWMLNEECRSMSMEVRRVLFGICTVGLIGSVELRVLERGRKDFDTDFGDGGWRGGGDDGPDCDTDIDSASGGSDSGICVNSADVVDGTRCAVE